MNIRLLLVFAFLAAPAFAAADAGSIQGRVFNPATDAFVRNAEVRITGTDRVAYSEEGGRYQFDNVPSGSVTLVVSFSGYMTTSASITVAAGARVTRDFELTSALAAPDAGAAVQMGRFVVSNDREGNAKAIMSQRRSMNIGTSVASDIFGDVAEGNVGEFLKYLPGVDLEYVDAETRGPRLGGLDPQYVGVTMDGQKMASADAFASYGSMINGSSGAASRSVGFEQMSINSIESIEVSRTTSSDMDADAPAGTINLKTKRAFDRKGRRIDWQVSLSANSDEFKLGKTYGPGDRQNRLIRPNFTLDYSDVFMDQRLGVRFGLSQSKVLYEQQYVTHTYNRTVTAADPRPTVLTGIVFTDGPKFVDRFTASLTADYKATSRLVLSLTAMFNAYDGATFTRALTFNAAANGTVAATGRQNVIGDGLTDIQTNGLASNTSRTLAFGGGNFDKLTNTVTFTPKFEYTLGSLLLDGAFTYSRSKNDYEGIVRGTARLETLNPLVTDFRATRPSPNSAEWTIVQAPGSPDWSNLANFTNPRLSSEDGRFAFVEIYNADFNARYTMPWSLPTFLKFGGKVNEEYRRSENRTVYNSYAYNGPGGGVNGSYAAFPSPRPFSATFGGITALNIPNMPTIVSRQGLGSLFQTHPEYFTNNATVENYYAAFYANKRDFKQTVAAAYGMANTRVGRWQFQGGVRWERTETESKEFNPLTAAQVQAAGFPISTATRRATTNAGIDYQFASRPRVTRRGVYDNFFPSISAKYTIRPDLFAQFGYSYAISRPPIDALAGVWSVNDTAQIVTAPNPDLKPELSDNYVARLAWYFSNVGSLTVLVQQNEISRIRFTRRFTADEFGYADDPAYAGYTFESLDNSSLVYRYRNLEVGYNQQLTFLPGALRGTSVNLSYTRSYANQWRPGVVPNKFTGGVSWNYQRFGLRAGGVWLDDAPFTTVFGRYQRHNFKLDMSGSYRIWKTTSLFFQGRNILNDPQLLYEGDPRRGIPAALYRYGNYGVSWTFGVKGNF
ncbi:MAG: TonB-dependent receptor [Opitutaceae bacterium]|nr:TonB-dependent receptor [Opitutaceae bacterium]